jgi:hypothetical protein
VIIPISQLEKGIVGAQEVAGLPCELGRSLESLNADNAYIKRCGGK